MDGYYSAMQNYSEDDFTKEILKPLFESMGFDRVEFHGGSYERGRDLIASSPIPGPKDKEYVCYVQSKKLDKKNRLAYNDLSRLIRQLKQAKSKGYRRNDGSLVKPDLVYIAVPNKITQRFLDEMQYELFEDNHQGGIALC